MKQKNKLLCVMKEYAVMLLLMVPLISFAQQSTVIRGTVVDSRGKPLAGVTVEAVDDVQNRRFQASANDKGIFSLTGLTAGKSYDVAFNRLGYERYVERGFLVRAGDNNSLLVRMSEVSEKVEEVVVVGYGTQRRALVTSAISKMNVDESTMRPVNSPAQLLDGRIAGVSTATGSGNLGSGERVSIRGISSLSASNEPLYVIDGVPITNSNSNLYDFGESMSSLATLNIADIESIEILKDAASAAIYGSRGTNGVVVITTRSGKEGRADIRLNVNGGMTQFPYLNKIKMADSELYVKSMNEGIANYNEQYGLQIG
ncbi:MAG TPA: TonB-dependent receptor plug domain-containing protein, partial [Sphingobacterium sp.]|nr:TonB-dependent receptor plug domain-containing protein [Sphingobacterium sp.]